MGYMYAVIWFVAGFVLIFRLAKENKIFYLAGAFFLVLGGWWLADAVQPAWKVFQGTPGVVLVILAVQFYLLNRAGRKADKPDKED